MNFNVDAAQSQREWDGTVELESQVSARPRYQKRSLDKGHRESLTPVLFVLLEF